MRIVVFGANGGTGRLLTEQALDAGHDVVAVTRKPDRFPLAHQRLGVVEADVHDGAAVVRAVDGADAVLSTLGVPFTRKPISIYSAGVANIGAAMEQHGVTRVVVVSSAGTEPQRHEGAGFLMNRVMQPLVTATIGKTTYADMRAMEAHLRASELEWTVMRPERTVRRPRREPVRAQRGPRRRRLHEPGRPRRQHARPGREHPVDPQERRGHHRRRAHRPCCR